MERYCIFACGGTGTRMGADVPKQFLRIEGKTILQISVERVLESIPDIRIVIALPSAWRDYWLDECQQRQFNIRQRIVDGGITRFHSIKNALEKVPEDAIVAVHDAVRPFASVGLIRSLFDEAAVSGSAVPVVPVTDTLKILRRNDAGQLEEVNGASADRSFMYGAQTPQVFHASVLKNAYELPYDTAFTDDASVVVAAGGMIKYIPGEKYNIKLTTPEDMHIACHLL